MNLRYGSVLGARRARLVRQLMTESLLLSIGGGLLGMRLGEAGLSIAKRFGTETIPHLLDTGLDLHVVAYAIGLTLITGLLFGLAPALGATQMNMAEALLERAANGRKRNCSQNS